MRVRVPPSAPGEPATSLKAAPKYQYRVAGIPVIVRHWLAPAPVDPLGAIRSAYARNYFRTVSRTDRKRIWQAWLSWPIVLFGTMARYSWRNAAIISARHGRPIPLQLADQLGCYFRYGILPRWYYIFSLYEEDPRRQAGCFLNRFETKLATFRLLNWPGSSPLNDKLAFADHCAVHRIASVRVIAIVKDGQVGWTGVEGLPWIDLFAKPVSARGGRGAQRWDHAGNGHFRDANGEVISGDHLLERLIADSAATPLLIQPRQVNHPDIADLSNGALSTVRVMSCLDENGVPEVVAAVFRMAIGSNITVDNIHAGGIAAEVGLSDGRLGPASNLGDDVRLGWLDRHPDSNAPISGRLLPFWEAVRALAVQAHDAFADRTVIGWDIAITADGPIVVEGNSGPDVDLLQRPMRKGLGCGRLGTLMALHLARRGHGPDPANMEERILTNDR